MGLCVCRFEFVCTCRVGFVCVGLNMCVYMWVCMCVCVCPRMVLYLPSADRKVDVRHHTSLPWFDPVSPGCVCLTSLSGYRVRLGAFILIAYDGLFILLVSDASFIHYLCTF